MAGSVGPSNADWWHCDIIVTFLTPVLPLLLLILVITFGGWWIIINWALVVLRQCVVVLIVYDLLFAGVDQTMTVTC